MEQKPNLIIIAGMPASGKSTVAGELSKIFAYPILEKDALKEELFDTIGFTCYAEKRRLDPATASVLLRCADSLLESGLSLILVNNFRTDMQDAVQAMIDKHDCNTVMVFFGGDGDVFYRRYVDRDLKQVRHAGHVVQDHYPLHEGEQALYTMTREEFADKFEKLGMADFKIDCPRIEVDATYPESIDIPALAEQIKKALSQE